MNRAVDETRRAYAVFGLPRGAAFSEVRRRYRALVKRWHPDLYAADAVNRAEAADRMREINAAYERLAQHLALVSKLPQAERSVASQIPKRGRLTREEIDKLVRAIGSEGPLEGLLSAVRWVGGSIGGLFALLFVVAFAARLSILLWIGDFSSLLTARELLAFLAILILLIVGTYEGRKKVER